MVDLTARKFLYTYGPVPSRRLGRSLGVSIIPPKACSYSCVYCQLGSTNQLRYKRESFFLKKRILDEIVNHPALPITEYITFVGDGEPTLSLDLGWLINETKRLTQQNIAVITNGSLLYRADVREDLKSADVVLPSLDAGSEDVFKKINRPHGKIRFDAMLQGLIDFRRQYTGQIWLEVMLVKDVNDTVRALNDLKKIIAQVNPHRIYIMTPVRPPAEDWAEPSSPDKIIRAQEILGTEQVFSLMEEGEFNTNSFTDAATAIMEIGTRHPLRFEQAHAIEDKMGQSGIVSQMIKEGKLVPVSYQRTDYLIPALFIRSGSNCQIPPDRSTAQHIFSSHTKKK